MALTLDHSLDRITTSSQRITIGVSGGIVMPKGTTAERPTSPVQGTVRYNTDLGSLEIFDSSLSWQPVASSGSGGTGSGDDSLVFALIFGS